MPKHPTLGWAVTKDGNIMMRTVTETEDEAKANAICIVLGFTLTGQPMRGWVNEVFNERMRPHGYEAVRVQCELLIA